MNEKFFHSPDSDNKPSTQKELAQDYGITQQTMNNYMRLTKAIPELENLVDTGIVTTHTALAIMGDMYRLVTNSELPSLEQIYSNI